MKKALVTLFAALAVSLGAQELASRFEVISIKPQPPPSGSGFSVSFGFQPGGRFVATGQSLGGLLPLAFRDGDRMRRPSEFFNVPSWAFGTLFSIEAKVGGEAAATPTTIDMFSARGVALIRSLLEERFKLQAHEEMREMPVYDLVLVKDGVLGPNIKPSTTDCKGAPPPISATGRPACGGRFGRGELYVGHSGLSALASSISRAVGNLSVNDKTALQGDFDYELHWAEEPAGPAEPGVASLPDVASIFTAVQEQLGMKLVSRKEVRSVVVIDHVEKPTED